LFDEREHQEGEGALAKYVYQLSWSTVIAWASLGYSLTVVLV